MHIRRAALNTSRTDIESRVGTIFLDTKGIIFTNSTKFQYENHLANTKLI
jgi:hypothetical protein